MKTSTKHHYTIAQNHHSLTAFLTIPKGRGQTQEAQSCWKAQTLETTGCIWKEKRSLLDAWTIPAELLHSVSCHK